MMQKAQCIIEKVPYCFSRSSVIKFEGHTANKIVDFDPNWAFPDCNSSLNSPKATKWCTNVEVAKMRCLGHPSNCKVPWDEISPIPNWGFLDCKSSLNSPMDLKWCTKLDVVQTKCPIVFRDHPSNFTVTRAAKLTIWVEFEITRPVAAIKSLRFALFIWWKLLLNTEKSQIVCFKKGRRSHNEKRKYGDQELKVVTSLSYLGIRISATGSFHQAQKHMQHKPLRQFPVYQKILITSQD